MASRSGTASRLTLALTQLALAAALVACGPEGPTPTAITAQPTEESVVVNGTARFVLNATGDGLKFQWQRSTNSGTTWTNVVGATQAVLEIANVTADQDGHLYRAQVSGDDGTVVVTSAVALHCDPVVVAPTFTVNLASPAEITEGADITLAVTAAGTSLTYLWETSPAGSSSWSALSGNNSPQLLLNDVPLSDNGRRYRVTISNSAGSVTSQTATLSVKTTPVTPTAPTVTTQPAAVGVTAPNAATFTVAVNGYPAPTVQWQSSTNNVDFTDISGANDLTYRIASTNTGLSGHYYRAKVSNSVDTVYSNAARLTITAAPVAPAIGTQPASQTVTVGAQASFTVAATGTPTPTIQWQISSNGGGTWANITGANSATYSFTTSAVGTSQYRAVASNGVGTAANSDPATLTVSASSGKAIYISDGYQIAQYLLSSTGELSSVGAIDACVYLDTVYGYNSDGILAITRSNNQIYASGSRTCQYSVNAFGSFSLISNSSAPSGKLTPSPTNNVLYSFRNDRIDSYSTGSVSGLSALSSYDFSGLFNNLTSNATPTYLSAYSVHPNGVHAYLLGEIGGPSFSLQLLSLGATGSISRVKQLDPAIAWQLGAIQDESGINWPYYFRVGGLSINPTGDNMYIFDANGYRIYQYSISQDSGNVTPLSPSYVSIAPASASSSIALSDLLVSPGGGHAYAIDSRNRKALVFSVRAGGKLEKIDTMDTSICPTLGDTYLFKAEFDPRDSMFYSLCSSSKGGAPSHLSTFSVNADGSLRLIRSSSVGGSSAKNLLVHPKTFIFQN